MRRMGLALAGALALCSTALIVVFALRSEATVALVAPGQTLDLGFQPHPGARLPLDAKATDETGRPVSLGDYFGKSPVILVLDYLRCKSLCAVTMQNLFVEDLNRLPLESGRDYQLVALSIDPRDTVSDALAARTKYAHLLDRGGGSGLHFLTARADAVHRIAGAVGFPYRYDLFLDAYVHPAGFIIASADGLISRYVEGLSISPAELVGAFADAQQDKTQSLFDRIVLLCHVEGAPLGRFTVPVMAALMLANIAAGLTLCALFAVIRRQG